MKVKFNNLIPDNGLLNELTGAYMKVMTSGQYIGGKEVEAFEQEWAAYCGAQYCVGVSSGQAALELLLKAHDIGYGDEVIVPSWTAVPTWKAVLNVGAMVRPIDVNPNTFLLEPESVMNQTGSKTKAVVPVHIYGYRADTNYGGWPVINDACQAHGLKNLGTAAWSFYPAKNLGAYGDGGAITTDDQGIAERVKEIRDSNRLDPLQAAFLRVKLGRLDKQNYIRSDNAITYDVLLNAGFINTFEGGIHHQYVIRVNQRDALKAHLASKGIETMIHYSIPPHRQLGLDFDLPVADELARTVLSLPITCSQNEVEYVCEVINEFYSD